MDAVKRRWLSHGGELPSTRQRVSPTSPCNTNCIKLDKQYVTTMAGGNLTENKYLSFLHTLRAAGERRAMLDGWERESRPAWVLPPQR